MSWNIPAPHFTLSIHFQIYYSTAFINSGGPWEISSLPCDHACGTCCCSSLDINSTDIRGHPHRIVPGYKLHIKRNKDCMNDLLLPPPSCLSHGELSFIIAFTPECQNRLWDCLPPPRAGGYKKGSPVNIPGVDPTAELGQKRKDLSLPAAVRIHLFTFFFPSGKKDCRKIPPPFFLFSLVFYSETGLKVWVWLVQDQAFQSFVAPLAPITQEQ